MSRTFVLVDVPTFPFPNFCPRGCPNFPHTLRVERPEEVADLIRRALRFIEPERLILSIDCGFGPQSMSRSHAFYKMVSLARGANIVRRELGLDEVYVPAADPDLSMVPST